MRELELSKPIFGLAEVAVVGSVMAASRQRKLPLVVVISNIRVAGDTGAGNMEAGDQLIILSEF